MKDTIQKLIQEKKFRELRTTIDRMYVADIAELFEELQLETIIVIFRLMSKDKAVETFSYLEPEHQKYIIDSISDRDIPNIINGMFIDDTVDFLEEMPAGVVNRVLKLTDEETRKTLNQFLAYPEYSAGSLMTIEMVALNKNMTVEKALDFIKQNGVDKETINNCYVTNQTRNLEGTVSIRKLILSEKNVLIQDIMHTDIIKVNTLDDQGIVVNLFKKYDYTVLPVVDSENCLVGIITIDDIMDVIEQENTEDFMIMAAVTPSDDVYIKTPVLKLVKNRVIWLMILMISATFTGMIIRHFSSVLESMVILASFIPMLMDTGGNSGTQASTMCIRSIALGELEIKDLGKVLWLEFRVSSLIGLILASFNFVRIIIFTPAGLLVALVVCTTLYFVVVVAKMLGCAMPLLAKKVGLDPAVMSTPLITTMVDALSLTLFFTLSCLILHI